MLLFVVSELEATWFGLRAGQADSSSANSLCVASIEFTSIVLAFEVDASEPTVCSTDLNWRDVRPDARFSHQSTKPCVSYAWLAQAPAPFELRSLSEKDPILS
jgi:hypothetical protein